MLIHEIQKLPDWVIELSLVFISAFVGHFIKVLMAQLPLTVLAESDSSAQPNSKQPWRTAFPLLSCFLPQRNELKLKGKANKKIAQYYFLLELFTILITLTVYQVLGMHVQTFCIMLFSWWLFALAIIDFSHYLLPDQLTLSLLWLGLLVNLHGLLIPLEYAVCSALGAYILMATIDSLYYVLRRRNGLGQGDWKLLAAVAAWLGFMPALTILALAAFLGSVWGVIGLANKKFKLTTPLAFGPFLCLAAWVFVLVAPSFPFHLS